jgi:hypothetical protein
MAAGNLAGCDLNPQDRCRSDTRLIFAIKVPLTK